MNMIVHTWLEAEREYYRLDTPADALRHLNEALGTKYQLSMLWAWRHPEQSHRSPNTQTRNYMTARSMPWLLQKCGIRATNDTARRISEALA